jgi:hypothetical protein
VHFDLPNPGYFSVVEFTMSYIKLPIRIIIYRKRIMEVESLGLPPGVALGISSFVASRYRMFIFVPVITIGIVLAGFWIRADIHTKVCQPFLNF